MTLEKTEEGSVRLVLESSEEAFRRIDSLFRSGQLTEILGLSVQGVQDATTSEDLVVLSRASQLLELGKDESVDNDFILNQLGLNRTDLEQLYIYLLRWARIESPTQLIKRFRHLFIDTSEETEPRIQSILSKISDPRFPVEEFNAILNRCC